MTEPAGPPGPAGAPATAPVAALVRCLQISLTRSRSLPTKAEVVEKWLTRTISNFDVSDLAQKEIAKLRAYKQGTMTTEIYFQELHSLITSTQLIYQIAFDEVPSEVAVTGVPSVPILLR